MKRNKLMRLLCSLLLISGAIYAFNKLYSLYAVRKHKLNARPENFFSWRGLKIYYHKKGKGSPVILLHAIHPASSAFEWNETEDKLALNHTVYALDLPGCGRSDKPGILYTSFFYSALLKDFAETMSIRHPAVVTSNLSAVAGIMAEAYKPGFISKIILISPPSPASLAETPDRYTRVLMKIMNNPFLGLFIYNILSSRPRVDYAFTEKYFYNPFHDNDELVEIYYESAQAGSGNGHYLYASMIGKYLNMNVDYAVSNLQIPVKIIEGESVDHALKIIEEWKNLNSGIESVVIPHTKQLPQLEEPDAVVREISAFL